MRSALQTANPALSGDAFTATRGPINDRQTKAQVLNSYRGDTMTLNGSISKSAVLLSMLVASGGWTWYLSASGAASVSLWMIGGFIVGFILAVITVFKKEVSPLTAPLYAIAEGCALGGLSAAFDAQYHGIVFQAVGLSIAVCAAMLVAYATRLIQPTQKFMLGVAAATGGIAIFYLVSMLLGFFGIHVPYVFAGGPIGIVFSAVVVVVAALNLIIDFAVIEGGVDSGAPKYMEWYGGFGLMVTLVWLYLEVLRLLAKLRGRD